MQFHNMLTLRWKILIGVVLASALSVILASVIYVSLQDSRISEAMTRESKVLTEVVGGNVRGALAFDDVDTAMEALRTFSANEKIIGAVVYGPEGNLFASYRRSSPGDVEPKIPSGFPSTRQADGQRFTDDYLEISHAIKDNGAPVGTIYIRVDLTELDEASADITKAAVLITLASVLLSVFLALFIQRAIVKPVNEVVSALQDIAEGEGDLTQRLVVSTNDEIGDLARWFNIFIEKVQGIVKSFSDTTVQLSDSSQSLLGTTEKTNAGIMRQQSEIEQVASAITEMSSTVQEVGRNVASAAQDAEEADAQAVQGREVVNQTKQAIGQLAAEIERAAEVITRLQKESDNIGSVLEVIGGIAEQTNLLALNAAIEAARAGEQGRGFAVVADEVRTLASRTQSSTQEIQEMIDRLQSGAKEAVQVMDKGREQAASSVGHAENADTALENITSAVAVIRDMTQQIATASNEQSAVTEEINQSVINISQVASQTSQDSQEIAAASDQLSTLSSELRQLVGQFRL